MGFGGLQEFLISQIYAIYIVYIGVVRSGIFHIFMPYICLHWGLGQVGGLIGLEATYYDVKCGI